jgi:ABC-type nickel/cobalt efflux system permease component RcnA
MKKLVAAAAIAGVAVVLPATFASAHPLGNLTVNSYSGLIVGSTAIRVDYVLDMAELPTVQERQAIDADHDRAVSAVEAGAYRATECPALANDLTLDVDGHPLALTVEQSTLTFPPGQGGLDTLRLECMFTAPATVTRSTRVVFHDGTFAGRIGWHEVTAVGDYTTLRKSDVANKSVSARLSVYPPSGASSPLRERDANIEAVAGGAPVSVAKDANSTQKPQSRGADSLTRAVNRIVGGRQLTTGLAVLAAAIAFLLGALHSLAPGHGKSLMAAYVVGKRGSARQVTAIGLTVAATHTAGVLTLGLLIWVSRAIAPDRLLPWLTVASGGLLAATGAGLLIRRIVHGPAGHHHHRHFGSHHDHDHEHPHDHHDHEENAPIRRRWLVLMGVAGGLVPTPSALVVLLGATALGRPWFGVTLVAVYGLGMAATLMAAGVALVRLQGWLETRWNGASWLNVTMRVAPLVTACLLFAGGLSIAARGAGQL